MYKISGLDNCIIGITADRVTEGHELRLVYSVGLVVKEIMRAHSITEEMAYRAFIEILDSDVDYELPVFVEAASLQEIERGETLLQQGMMMMNEEIH